MLQRLADLPPGIDGVKATGTVSKEEYEQVFEPMLEEARREGKRLRLVYQFGPSFERFTAGAAWEDITVGLRSLRLFDGCAIVSDVGWVRESARLAGVLMPCPVRVFDLEERGRAVEWLASLPQGAAASHRVLADSGVIVLELRRAALRAEDFDALSATADHFIESHGSLRGLVIHARAFPGWENLGGFLGHMEFVRDYQRKVSKIALCTDSKLARLTPRIAEHFVRAELRQFPYASVDQAIAWASEAPAADTP
ncbi:MAG TPA: STAS/SEC14 domain-containing protein [Polyangiaceae bacterium]|jgi:hypothetical protein